MHPFLQVFTPLQWGAKTNKVTEKCHSDKDREPHFNSLICRYIPKDHSMQVFFSIPSAPKWKSGSLVVSFKGKREKVVPSPRYRRIRLPRPYFWSMVRQAARRGWAISTAVKEPEAPRSSATMHSFAPAHLTPSLFQILQTLQIRLISHIYLLNYREISKNKQFDSNTTMSAVITLMQVAHKCVGSSPSSLANLLCSLAEKRNYQEQHRDQEHGHSVTPPTPPQLHLRLHLSRRAVCTTFNLYNLENCLHAMKNNKHIERSRSSISVTNCLPVAMDKQITFPCWYAQDPAICASGGKLKNPGSHATLVSLTPSSSSISTSSKTACSFNLDLPNSSSNPFTSLNPNLWTAIQKEADTECKCVLHANIDCKTNNPCWWYYCKSEHTSSSGSHFESLLLHRS